jgi:stearoyl-CoA desaturase (delta-9 desaturase)
MIGKQPYSTDHSARDSWIAAIFTMGEGYHNYHHEFAWDYRNGVKPWQLDPSKWIIWVLSKFGLTSHLKRVANERILLAETKEMHRIVETKLSAFQSAQETGAELVDQAVAKLEKVGDRLTEIRNELQTAIRDKIDLSKSKIKELQSEVRTMIDEVETFGQLANA